MISIHSNFEETKEIKRALERMNLALDATKARMGKWHTSPTLGFLHHLVFSHTSIFVSLMDIVWLFVLFNLHLYG
jgi:hypothetical protein